MIDAEKAYSILSGLHTPSALLLAREMHISYTEALNWLKENPVIPAHKPTETSRKPDAAQGTGNTAKNIPMGMYSIGQDLPEGTYIFTGDAGKTTYITLYPSQSTQISKPQNFQLTASNTTCRLTLHAGDRLTLTENCKAEKAESIVF